MATDISIAIFNDAKQTSLGTVLASEVVSITGSSVQSSSFVPDSELNLTARLQPDTACWVAWGENPTAKKAAPFNTSIRMGAGSTEYIGIKRGDKIAVISL